MVHIANNVMVCQQAFLQKESGYIFVLVGQNAYGHRPILVVLWFLGDVVVLVRQFDAAGQI